MIFSVLLWLSSINSLLGVSDSLEAKKIADILMLTCLPTAYGSRYFYCKSCMQGIDDLSGNIIIAFPLEVGVYLHAQRPPGL